MKKPTAKEKADTRPRNSFGILLGFGKAYSVYYKRQDRRAALAKKGAK